MNRDIISIYNITAVSIEKYLLLNNWNRDYGFKNKNLMVFSKDERKLAIPASEEFEDFYYCIESIIETISLIKNKTVEEIIKEINTSYYDRLEIRIVSDFSEKGKLPLGYATQCLQGLKDLVLYSACAEQNAEPICPRATNNAIDIVNNFKLAQTDVGSFIINIDIAVADEKYEQFTLDQCDVKLPIEHKIVKRISMAIKQVDEVVNDNIKIDNIISDAYKVGLTANICEALLKLKPDNRDIEIDTTIRYASALSKKTGDLENFRMKNNHFFAIQEISKRFHDNKKYDFVEIRGIIKSLKKYVSEKRKYKIVYIISFINDSYHSIKVQLNDNDYRLACDAHRDEREISVTGMLDMSKKIWELNDANSFILL